MTFRKKLFDLHSSIGEKLNQKLEIKTKTEIELIRKSCQITTQIFNEILNDLSSGASEKDIADLLLKKAQKLGAEKMAFPTIVASGKRNSEIHGDASDLLLKKNTMIMFDLGVVYKGYCSDLTRTIFWGDKKKVSKKQVELYEYIKEIQQKAMDMVKPGVNVSRIDKFVRKEFKKTKNLEFYPHSLGHGVGIRVHERPTVSWKNDKSILKKGMIITIEPGVYYPKEFGVRIEDTLLVTNDGYENLTKNAKKDFFYD
jgi:Xaa-Pro aminopeptidase